MRNETESTLIFCGIVILLVIVSAKVGKHIGIAAFGMAMNGAIILPVIAVLSLCYICRPKKLEEC